MFGHLQGSFCPCCPTKYSKMIETFACSVAQGPGFSNIYWVSFSISLQSHSCGVYYIYYTYHTRKSWARSQHVLRKSGFAQLCCWPPWILEGQLENMTCSCFAVATSVQKALIRTLSKTSSGFLMYFQPKEEPKKLKVNLGLLWSIEDFYVSTLKVVSAQRPCRSKPSHHWIHTWKRSSAVANQSPWPNVVLKNQLPNRLLPLGLLRYRLILPGANHYLCKSGGITHFAHSVQ